MIRRRPPVRYNQMVGISVDEIIRSGGIIVVSLIVFAESGLLVGFFLPGDTLLFGAGLAASQGEISIVWLIAAVVFAAIVGDNVGYSIGQRAGEKLFTKDDGVIFRKEYVERAADFYEKHGGKTIIIARFTPIVRTFAPVVAGAGKMSHKRFFVYNVIGGILWGAGIPLLGYYLGGKIPHLDQYIELVILGVMILSLLLASGHVLKDKRTRRHLITSTKRGLKNAKRKFFAVETDK